jgi:hypothetical protein
MNIIGPPFIPRLGGSVSSVPRAEALGTLIITAVVGTDAAVEAQPRVGAPYRRLRSAQHSQARRYADSNTLSRGVREIAMQFIGSTKLEDFLTPKRAGEPVNAHVVTPPREPAPDFDAMQKVIQGGGEESKAGSESRVQNREISQDK